MKKKEKLELRKWSRAEEGELSAVSVVVNPAIQKGFQMFGNVTNKQVFSISEEKQELTGPIMIPNLPILRKDKDGEFFNCWFSEEDVKDCAMNYLKNSNHNKTNFNHTREFTDKVYMIESWFVEDPENDKSNALGATDITKGTWFGTFKVEDKETWNYIKKMGFTGFSVEGSFVENSEEQEDEVLNKIFSVIMSNISDEDKDVLIKKIIDTTKIK